MKITQYALAAFLTLVSVSAFSHDSVAKSSPTDKEVLKTTPSAFTLHFDAEVHLIKVKLLTWDEDEIKTGFKLSSDKSKSYSVKLPKLEQGKYKIQWSILSQDGHKVGETIRFAVQNSAASNKDNSGSTITIPFLAKAGNTEINCDAMLKDLGTSKGSGKVADFAFYIHGVQVKNGKGETFPLQLTNGNYQDAEHGVALLDFQDKLDGCAGGEKPTNKSVTGKVAGIDTADIKGVEFIVGVPTAMNHHNASTTQAPYNRSGLFWRWQSGHKFIRADLKPTEKVTFQYDTTKNKRLKGKLKGETFQLHLGSTGCKGDPTQGQIVGCASENKPPITLEGLTVGDNNITNTVVFDYANLVSTVDVTKDYAFPAGCMSGKKDVECQSIFKTLGMNIKDGKLTGEQIVFHLAK